MLAHRNHSDACMCPAAKVVHGPFCGLLSLILRDKIFSFSQSLVVLICAANQNWGTPTKVLLLECLEVSSTADSGEAAHEVCRRLYSSRHLELLIEVLHVVARSATVTCLGSTGLLHIHGQGAAGLSCDVHAVPPSLALVISGMRYFPMG